MANYAARFYRHAMVDVRVVQNQLMDQSIAAVIRVEQLVLSMMRNTPSESGKMNHEIVSVLTDTVHSQADMVVARWQKLLYEIITRYHDGYSAENLDTSEILMKKLFYPKAWLDISGFWDNNPNEDPHSLLFESRQDMITIGHCNGNIFQVVFWTALLSSVITTAAIWFSHRCSMTSKGYVNMRPGVYMPVEDL